MIEQHVDHAFRCAGEKIASLINRNCRRKMVSDFVFFSHYTIHFRWRVVAITCNTLVESTELCGCNSYESEKSLHRCVLLMWFSNAQNAWSTDMQHKIDFEWCEFHPPPSPTFYVFIFSPSRTLLYSALLSADCIGVMSNTKCDLCDRYRFACGAFILFHTFFIVVIRSIAHRFLLFAAVNLFPIQSHECLHWNSIQFTSRMWC